MRNDETGTVAVVVVIDGKAHEVVATGIGGNWIGHEPEHLPLIDRFNENDAHRSPGEAIGAKVAELVNRAVGSGK